MLFSYATLTVLSSAQTKQSLTVEHIFAKPLLSGTGVSNITWPLDGGREFQDVIHKRLGYYELQNQLAGVEYVRSLSYVDSSRIMIWGKVTVAL